MEFSVHRSVLVEESVQALAVANAGCYVDATFGRGGHSRALLQRLAAAGRVLGFDRDPQAEPAGRLLEREDARFTFVPGCFGDLSAGLAQAGRRDPVAGILLDLGVSSPQLDDPARGFSFQTDGPLDMRMDPRQGISAAQWLATATEAAIADTLLTLGEERFARRIARAVVRERNQTPLTSTRALAELVARAVPTREAGKHPATRTFQALRLCVNDELGELRRGLAQVCDWLATGGRLVVISFHSLEDRLVKQFIRAESRGPVWPKGLPVQTSATAGRLRPLGRAVRPGAAEVAANPRARSAIMRVAERLS